MRLMATFYFLLALRTYFCLCETGEKGHTQLLKLYFRFCMERWWGIFFLTVACFANR